MKLNRSQFKLLILLAIFTVGGFLIWWKLNYLKQQTGIPEVTLEIKEKSPVQKGIDFLLTTNEKFVGGTTFLIKKLNEICGDERLEDLWKRNLDGDIGDQKFLYRLYDPNYQYPDISDLENIPDLNTRLIAKAAYCEKFSYENALKDVNQIKKDQSYNSTHLLLALTIAREKNCYDRSILNTQIDELAKNLRMVQDKEGELENLPYLCNPHYLDIYAERAAVMGYAGYSIKSDWIENILRCQAENGSWFDDPHTTSLALWAITQKNRSCTENTSSK